MILCDTHALLLDALAPKRLGAAAAHAIEAGFDAGELACADVSLWEIARLIELGKVRVAASAANLLLTVIAARRLSVLPVTPTIAALAASGEVPVDDPADRLIAATALVHRATLVTKDKRLHRVPGLRCVW